MGIDVAKVRRRLSLAAVRANNTVLLARLGQVGEGSGLARRRRAWQMREEGQVVRQREADWLVAAEEKEIVRSGRCWGRYCDNI